MLQNLRENSQGIVAKIIVGFIILTFSLWGVDSLVGLATSEDPPVVVDGREITETEILRALELERRQLTNELGEDLDPALLEDERLRPRVVERLVEEALLLNYADAQGLVAGTAVIDSMIRNTADFQVDGQFDQDRFLAVLRGAGLTPILYRDLLQRDILAGQLRSAFAASAFATREEAALIAGLDRQQRRFRYARYPLEPALEKVSLTEEELAAYYQAEGERFATPEQVKIRYLLLDRQNLATEVKVTDQEVAAAYADYREGYEAEEARQAAHILIATGSDRSAQEAEAQARELAREMAQGASFAELAREHSDDPGSASQGGDLGVVERGVMVPAFEEALFSLEEGQVSQPVETEFGYHLIKVTDIESGEVPSLAEVRDRLVEDIRVRRAERLFVDKLEQLADLSFSATDLKEPAQVLDLKIHEAGPFGREGGDTALTSNSRIVEAAFSESLREEGYNSEVLELRDGRALVLRVSAYLPARQPPLEEVRTELAEQLRQERASELVLEQARKDLQNLRQSRPITREWRQEQTLGRRGNAQLPAELVNALFRMPASKDGATGDVLALQDGSAVLMELLEVIPGRFDSLEPQQQGQLRDFVASQLGQQAYRGLVANLRAEAEIERL